jgi:hypothetical protein
VSRIKVLLAPMPPLVRGLLTYVISSQADMRIVGRPTSLVGLLRAVGRRGDRRNRRRPEVVLIPLEYPARIPGICTHLLAEDPDLLVLGIPAQGHTVVAFHRRTIIRERLENQSVDDLLKAIRVVRT